MRRKTATFLLVFVSLLGARVLYAIVMVDVPIMLMRAYFDHHMPYPFAERVVRILVLILCAWGAVRAGRILQRSRP